MLRGRIQMNRTPAAQDPCAWVAIVYESTTGRILYQHKFATRNEALSAINKYMDDKRFNRTPGAE